MAKYFKIKINRKLLKQKAIEWTQPLLNRVAIDIKWKSKDFVPIGTGALMESIRVMKLMTKYKVIAGNRGKLKYARYQEMVELKHLPGQTSFAVVGEALRALAMSSYPNRRWADHPTYKTFYSYGHRHARGAYRYVKSYMRRALEQVVKEGI